MELGTGGFESQRVKKVYFTLEDGDNVFRILPALGNLAAKNIWSKFYRVEFGYYDSKGKMKVFQCPRVVNFKTKMIEVESAAYLKREKLLKARDAVVDFLKSNPGDQKKESEREKLNVLLRQFNSDGKFYVNAIDLNGRIGLLKLGKTAFDDLKNEMRKLNDTGTNPLAADTGRFFVINKTGQLRDTAYKVTLFKEQKEVALPDGTKVLASIDVVHKLTSDIISRLKEEAFKLDEIYPQVTPEQVERIVAGEAVDIVVPYIRSESQEIESKATTPKTTYAQRADNAQDEELERLVSAVETKLTAPKEIAKTEVAKTEVAKTEVAKTEVAKTEVAKTEVAKTEVARPTVINTPVEEKVAKATAPQEMDDIDALLAQVMNG